VLFSVKVILLVLYSCLLIADCGEGGATTTVLDLDDVASFNQCSTFHGSLFFHTSTDSNWDNITMPSALSTISGGLYCGGGGSDNTTDSIFALALQSVASDRTDQSIGHVGFVIVDYPTLSSLDFPDLATVGSDFIIARNPKLTTIAFAALKSVTGNVDITGDYQTLELPSLSFVNGSVNLQTSSASFNCPTFGNVSILGAYACSVGVNDPEPLPADNSSTNPSAINVISAGTLVPSTAVSSSRFSSIVSTSTLSSSSQSSASSSNSASSSPSARSTTSSASYTKITVNLLRIVFIQILCLFFI